MKVIVFISVLLSSLIYANEIQVFNTNTMHIDLDSKTEITPLSYCQVGTECSNLFDDKTNSNFVVASLATGAAYTATGTVINNNMTFQGGNDLVAAGIGTLAGLAIVVASGWVDSEWTDITSDHEYIISSFAKNSQKQETVLMTLIVSNYELNQDEAIKIAADSQKKLLK